MKTTSNMKTTSKMKTISKVKMTSKIKTTFHLNSQGQLILNWIRYLVFKPEMEVHMINIIYAALPMCAQTEKTTFSCKDDYCKALHIYWSGGEGLAHWRSTHGAGRKFVNVRPVRQCLLRLAQQLMLRLAQ